MRNGQPAIMRVMKRALDRFSTAAPTQSGNPGNTRDDTAPAQAFSSANARAEGWDVFECGVHEDGSPRVQIQRLDDPGSGPPVFAGDAEAWQHIVERARQGSALHLQALRRVDPVERLLIEASCGGWTAPQS